MTTAPTSRDWMRIVLLGVIWGGTFMVVRTALDGYGPLTVAAARTTLGALALLTVMAALGQRLPRDRRTWAFLLPIGLLSTAVPFTLLSWGQQYVPSAFAGLSMTALPVFVLPLAHVFSDEPLTRRRVAATALGLAGVVVLLGPSLLAEGGGGALLLPELACLGAALCYAVASILTRRCPPVGDVPLSAASLAVGAVALVPAMLAVEGVPGWAGPVPGAAIVFLGLLPTALAALLRVATIRSAGSNFMSLVNFQVPVWSMAFGAVVLGEDLPGRFFLALALILSGLALSRGARNRRATAKA